MTTPGIQFGSHRCQCHQRHQPIRFVSVTGGPGAGKTAVLEMATRAFCHHVGVTPEAASVLFGGGFPRRDSQAGRRAAQRAIYHVQREIETLIVEDSDLAIALCDRGTVDGVAYWPDSPESYWSAVGTTAEAELARYDTVIHLETPTDNNGYDRSNPLRIESAETAHRIDDRIATAWACHPNRHVIPSTDNFFDKMIRALEIIRGLLPACCGYHPEGYSLVGRHHVPDT